MNALDHASDEMCIQAAEGIRRLNPRLANNLTKVEEKMTNLKGEIDKLLVGGPGSEDPDSIEVAVEIYRQGYNALAHLARKPFLPPFVFKDGKVVDTL